MSDKWIIEVLSDLKSFSQQNGLFDLADAIESSLTVARRDLNCCGSDLARAGDPSPDRQPPPVGDDDP